MTSDRLTDADTAALDAQIAARERAHERMPAFRSRSTRYEAIDATTGRTLQYAASLAELVADVRRRGKRKRRYACYDDELSMSAPEYLGYVYKDLFHAASEYAPETEPYEGIPAGAPETEPYATQSDEALPDERSLQYGLTPRWRAVDASNGLTFCEFLMMRACIAYVREHGAHEQAYAVYFDDAVSPDDERPVPAPQYVGYLHKGYWHERHPLAPEEEAYMPRKKSDPPKAAVSFRLSRAAVALLDALRQHEGIEKSAILESAIRQRARRAGIDVAAVTRAALDAQESDGSDSE
jgi:hypothetical protein